MNKKNSDDYYKLYEDIISEEYSGNILMFTKFNNIFYYFKIFKLIKLIIEW